MISFFRITTVVAVLSFGLLNLCAKDSPFALPAGEPLATLALPDGLNRGDVSIAVSKVLVAANWENLGWEGNVTTATTKKSRITLKVFVLSAASEVKFYATYTSENKVTEDKLRQMAVRELRALGRDIAEELNLTYRKAKGDGTVDRAVQG